MPSSATQQTDRLVTMAASVSSKDAYRGAERRAAERFLYVESAALVLLCDAAAGPPIMVKSKDISSTGMCVVSRQMLHPGREGVMQLLRSDGSAALVGVKVSECRYVGNMQHETGLMFIPLDRRPALKGLVAHDHWSSLRTQQLAARSG